MVPFRLIFNHFFIDQIIWLLRMAESELLGLLKIYTFLTNVKQPMQMQINVEISVAFFCTTLLARRLVPLSAQGRNTNVRRQVFWLSGSLPRIWSRICTQSPKIQQEIDSGKLIKELVPFTQLVKVRRGKLVLALPSIRFSWNFYQIISGTKYE